MVKNLETFNLFMGLIISVGYDIVKIIKHTINRKFDCVVAILKGNYIFIKELPKTLIEYHQERGGLYYFDRELKVLDD